MRTRVFTKPRTVIGTVLGIGLAAGIAFAAWTIYSGVTGSANGKIAATGSATALTFSDNTTQTNVDVVPGGTEGQINYVITNNDPTNAHSWTTPGVTFTTSDVADNCAAHLSVAADNVYPSVLIGSVGSGSNATTAVLKYQGDATMPLACATATVTATFTGSSS